MSNPSLNRIVSEIVRTVNVRTTVARILPVLPVLVVMGLTGFAYSWSSQRSVKPMASALQQEIGDRIEQYLETELAIPEQIVDANTDAIAVGLLNFNNLSRWEAHLKRQILQAENLETIAIANRERELVSVKKLDGRVFVHSTQRQGGAGNSANAQPAFPSWYATALQRRQSIWTEDRVQGTPPQRAIGMAQPVYGKQGNLVGVLACFVSLADASEFLQQLNLGRDGRAFIVDGAGQLVATSVVASGEASPLDLLAADSPDALIQRTAQHLAQHLAQQGSGSDSGATAQHLAFHFQGQRQFLQVQRFSVGSSHWSIVVVLPESHFRNATPLPTRVLVLLSAIALPIAAIAHLSHRRKPPVPQNPPADCHPLAPPPAVATAGDASDIGSHSEMTDSLMTVPTLLPIPTLFPNGETSRAIQPPPFLSYENGQPDRPIRLLVVDDTSESFAILTQFLSLEYYKISVVPSSLEAFHTLQENLEPDLILFDAQMSDLCGSTFCQKVREKFRFYELPIIILTDPAQDAETSDILNWGANDYLTKPIVKHELISRIRTHLHLAHLNAAYSRFVPKQFLQLLQKESIVDVKLGDNTLREMSVLFSDIRSFTTISEKMTPEENFRFINSYLSRMEPVIMANSGFIDKYIGDSIMALFSGSADDAIKAGIAMLQTLVEYNQHRANVGYPAIKIGIGINTGSLMLGTVGGINRMDGTVISDAVNLASRIESLTKEYGVSLLISHQTFAKLQNPSDYNMRLIERLKVKGKSKAVAVFEVFDGDPPELREAKLATTGIFEEGVLYYYGSSFRKAAQRFEECLVQNPKDKVAQIYLDRCRQVSIKVEGLTN